MPVLPSLFNKAAVLKAVLAATLLKKTPTQAFFCEYCEVFKNVVFTEHFRISGGGLIDLSF